MHGEQVHRPAGVDWLVEMTSSRQAIGPQQLSKEERHEGRKGQGERREGAAMGEVV